MLTNENFSGPCSGGDTFDNQALTNQLIALNQPRQMMNISRWGYNGEPGYLSLVNNSGVSLFMNFTDRSTYSKWDC